MREQVAQEVAEQEFDRFVDAMRLDVDPAGWDDEDKKSFTDSRNKILAAMRTGSLVIDERGQPSYTPSYGDNTQPVVFYRPTGATLMAMDGRKKGHDQAKLLAAMADMTRENASRFAKMDLYDLKVCQSVMLLFLA